MIIISVFFLFSLHLHKGTYVRVTSFEPRSIFICLHNAFTVSPISVFSFGLSLFQLKHRQSASNGSSSGLFRLLTRATSLSFWFLQIICGDSLGAHINDVG